MITGYYNGNPVWIAKVGVGDHGNCAVIIDQNRNIDKVWLSDVKVDVKTLTRNSHVS